MVYIRHASTLAFSLAKVQRLQEFGIQSSFVESRTANVKSTQYHSNVDIILYHIEDNRDQALCKTRLFHKTSSCRYFYEQQIIALLECLSIGGYYNLA
jgi:hypothetical protein